MTCTIVAKIDLNYISITLDEKKFDILQTTNHIIYI